MARQKTYLNDTNLTGLDKLTGVSAETGATANFTLDALATFFAQSGNSDGTRAGFHFEYGGVYNPDAVLEDGKIYIGLLSGASESTGFAAIDAFYFKNESADHNNFRPVRTQIQGGVVKLTNVNTPGERGYGLYSVVVAEAADIEDTSTKLSVGFLSGDGELGLDNLVLSPFGTGGSGGGGDVDSDEFFAGDYDPNSVSDFGNVGDIFFRTDTKSYYQKSLNGWGDPISLQGNPGVFNDFTAEVSETLPAGQPASVETILDVGAGTVQLDFKIPQGADGAEGPQGPVTPFTFGNTVTGVPGSQASVENTGTATAPNLIFTVPRGDKGEKGDTGTGSTININGPEDFSETGITTLTFGGTAVTEIVRPEGSDDVTITLTDTDTTYTAGAGISIENSVITNTRPDTNTQLTDEEVIQAIVRSDNISSIDQQTIRENIGAGTGGGGDDYVLPVATASTLGGVRVLGSSKININALGQIDVEDITASDIDSEAATTGQILTANGSGGAQWSSPTDASLPLAADGTRGGIQIGYTETGSNYAVRLDGEKAYVTVPTSDSVIANPGGTGDALTTIEISGTVYEVSGGSGTGEIIVGDGTDEYNVNRIDFVGDGVTSVAVDSKSAIVNIAGGSGGGGTTVQVNGEDQSRIELESNNTEVGGIVLEYQAEILTYVLGTHGSSANQFLGTDSDGNLAWRDGSGGTDVEGNPSGDATETDALSKLKIDTKIFNVDTVSTSTNPGEDLDQITINGVAYTVAGGGNATNEINVSIPGDGPAKVGTIDFTGNITGHLGDDDATVNVPKTDWTATDNSGIDNRPFTELEGPQLDNSASINPVTTTSGRYYYVQQDHEGKLVVNVPWNSQSGTKPDLGVPTTTWNTGGAAMQDITVTVSTTKNDAVTEDYSLALTSSHGTVTGTNPISNPSDGDQTFTITNAVEGTLITATLTYKFEGQANTTMESTMTTLPNRMVDQPTYTPTFTYSGGLAPNSAPTNSHFEAYDTPKVTVTTLLKTTDNNGWDVSGTPTYTPTLDSDNAFTVANNANTVNFKVDVDGWTQTGETPLPAQTLGQHNWSRVFTFRSGGIANAGDDTTITAADMMDLDMFKDDLIMGKTDSPDDYTWNATVKNVGDRQYFAYSSSFPEADLAASRQGGIFPLTNLYNYKGVVAGFHLYVGASGVTPSGAMNTLKLKST